MSDITYKFNELDVKIMPIAKPMDIESALRVQAGAGKISADGHVCVLDLENKVSIHSEVGNTSAVFGGLDNCVFLVITKAPISRSYYVPIAIEDIATVDAKFTEFMAEAEDKMFVINTTSVLSEDNRIIGRHSNNSNWPAKFVNLQWLQIITQNKPTI